MFDHNVISLEKNKMSDNLGLNEEGAPTENMHFSEFAITKRLDPDFFVQVACNCCLLEIYPATD